MKIGVKVILANEEEKKREEAKDEQELRNLIKKELKKYRKNKRKIHKFKHRPFEAIPENENDDKIDINKIRKF